MQHDGAEPNAGANEGNRQAICQSHAKLLFLFPGAIILNCI